MDGPSGLLGAVLALLCLRNKNVAIVPVHVDNAGIQNSDSMTILHLVMGSVDITQLYARIQLTQLFQFVVVVDAVKNICTVWILMTDPKAIENIVHVVKRKCNVR